jgi:hypothetical protein
MRIEYPRAPLQVKDEQGNVKYRIGPAMKKALQLVLKHGGAQKPPEGEITSTGQVRNHNFNDMVPYGLVRAEVRQPGLVDYHITAFGKKVLANAIVSKEPARKKRGRVDGRKSAKVVSLRKAA